MAAQPSQATTGQGAHQTRHDHHHYRPLSAQEQAFVLARHWPEMGLGDTTDFTTSEAVAAITPSPAGTSA